LKRYTYDVVDDLKTELDFYLIDIPEITKYAILIPLIPPPPHGTNSTNKAN
jgi:hypothetical protein